MNTSIESISLHYLLPEFDRIDESDPYAVLQRLHYPGEPLYLELFAFVLIMQGVIYFAINSNNLFMTDDDYATLHRRLVVFLALVLPTTSMIVVFNYIFTQQNSFTVDLPTINLLLYTMSFLFSGSVLLDYYRKTS
ncbi:MAG: hypothetical protein ACW99Q_13625 [Candidatus Kariarchaeaceae archaeon]|jgi:hypothetical protein